jgi:hypothetical protein
MCSHNIAAAAAAVTVSWGSIIVYTPPTHIPTTIALHAMCTASCVNRQARVALGDRIRNSLQLTALRLKPSRLLGVQALTLHYP